MGLRAQYNTRLKALGRMHRETGQAIQDGARAGKNLQNLIDDRTVLGLCLRIFRDDPEYVMRKIIDDSGEPPTAGMGERVRAAAEAVERDLEQREEVIENERHSEVQGADHH